VTHLSVITGGARNVSASKQREENLRSIEASLTELGRYGFCGISKKLNPPLSGSAFLFVMSFISVGTRAACLELLSKWRICNRLKQVISTAAAANRPFPFKLIRTILAEANIQARIEPGLPENHFTIALDLANYHATLFEGSDYVNALAWYRGE
jgi:hypothetical protein